MNSNEQLRLSYIKFCMNYKGSHGRVEFSNLLGLPITATGRTPTLDNWLSPSESNNFRKAPMQVARLARLLLLLAEVLPVLDIGEKISNQQFWLLENLCGPGWEHHP